MVLHVLPEVEAQFVHLACHRLGLDVLVADPWVVAAEHVEGPVEEFGQRSGRPNLVETFHAFLVLDALHLEPVDQLGLQAVDLGGQDHPRVLEYRFDDRQHVQGVLFRCVVGPLVTQFGDHLEGEQRQWLVEGEVVLEVHPDPDHAALVVGPVQYLDDAGIPE